MKCGASCRQPFGISVSVSADGELYQKGGFLFLLCALFEAKMSNESEYFQKLLLGTLPESLEKQK